MIQEFLINNNLIKLLGILIVADIITGIIKATKKHSIKSAILRHGGYKKFLIILIVVLAWSMDKIYFNSDILYTISCTYYILNEMISITENIGQCGVPIPRKLKDILSNLNDRE